MQTSTAPVAKIDLVKTLVGLLLLILIAYVFAWGALGKMVSIDAFEWSFIDLGLQNFTLAAVAARVMIGLELVLAFFLVMHLYLRSFTYPAIFMLLIIFNIYLVMLLVKQGDTGNCGCFGDWVYMTPLKSIYKNIAMMVAVVILWLIYPVRNRNIIDIMSKERWRFKNFTQMKYRSVIAPIVAMVAIIIPFVVSPMSIGHNPVKTHEEIDLSSLYVDTTGQNNIPTVALREGKHIVSYMSLTCPHCRKAAYLLQIIHRQHPDIPIHFVLSGQEEYEQEFFDETHAQAVPHTFMYGRYEDFKTMAGGSVPAIYWINNGVIEAKSNYNQLDPAVMEDWLKN